MVMVAIVVKHDAAAWLIICVRFLHDVENYDIVR